MNKVKEELTLEEIIQIMRYRDCDTSHSVMIKCIANARAESEIACRSMRCHA